MVAMNEWKKKCVGLQWTWVSKRTVCWVWWGLRGPSFISHRFASVYFNLLSLPRSCICKVGSFFSLSALEKVILRTLRMAVIFLQIMSLAYNLFFVRHPSHCILLMHNFYFNVTSPLNGKFDARNIKITLLGSPCNLSKTKLLCIEHNHFWW